MRKPKTQKAMIDFLNCPGVICYFYRGKAEELAAKRLEEKGKVTREDKGYISSGRFNRKFVVSGIIRLISENDPESNVSGDQTNA